MKIAIIINTSWNIYNFRRGLIRHFMDQGHEVVAIAPEDDYAQKLIEMGCGYYPLNFPGTSMNPITEIGLLIRLYNILRVARPDIILSYTIKPNIYSSMVGGFLRIPCICNVSGLGTVFLWKGRLKKIAISLYTFAFRFSKWVFFQNEEDREDFIKLIPLKESKTSILPGSGVNLDHFHLVPFKESQPITFLMISRLIIDKGVLEFAEAARMIHATRPEVKFIILGGYDPTHARSISESIFEGWKKSEFIQWKNHVEDTRPIIAAADVVVLPSYREGTPKTLLEAGAMGKGLIATNVPGCRQVVQDGYNGFLCQVKNPKDLAAKIRLYLSLSIQEMKQMHLNSRKHIESQYDEKLVIGLYEQKIKELTKKS